MVGALRFAANHQLLFCGILQRPPHRRLLMSPLCLATERLCAAEPKDEQTGVIPSSSIFACCELFFFRLIKRNRPPDEASGRHPI